MIDTVSSAKISLQVDIRSKILNKECKMYKKPQNYPAAEHSVQLITSSVTRSEIESARKIC